MSEKMYVVLGTIGALVLMFLIVIPMSIMGIYNEEVALHNRFEAQENAIETTHDTMWKTIKQKYQIKNDYEATFKDGLAAVAEGRKGGSLFKSSTEASSQLGLSETVYSEMMNTIEGKRQGLKNAQDTLTDIWREHKTHCESMPNALLLSGKVMPKPEMISSGVTKQAIDTKMDDDISLGTKEKS